MGQTSISSKEAAVVAAFVLSGVLAVYVSDASFHKITMELVEMTLTGVDATRIS